MLTVQDTHMSNGRYGKENTGPPRQSGKEQAGKKNE